MDLSMLTGRFVLLAGFGRFIRLNYMNRLWLRFVLRCCFELIWIDVLVSRTRGFHRNRDSSGLLLTHRTLNALRSMCRPENTRVWGRHGLLGALCHRNSFGSADRTLQNIRVEQTFHYIILQMLLFNVL